METISGRKIDPDSVGWHHQGMLDFNNRPDDYTLSGWFINSVLSLFRSNKRMRLILYEDAIRARGIMTPEQGREVALRLEIGADGNFHDPKKKTIFDKLRALLR